MKIIEERSGELEVGIPLASGSPLGIGCLVAVAIFMIVSVGSVGLWRFALGILVLVGLALLSLRLIWERWTFRPGAATRRSRGGKLIRNHEKVRSVEVVLRRLAQEGSIVHVRLGLEPVGDALVTKNRSRSIAIRHAETIARALRVPIHARRDGRDDFVDRGIGHDPHRYFPGE